MIHEDILTPKEKARALVLGMFLCLDSKGKFPMCLETSKQAAIITVQEILSLLTNSLYEDKKSYYRKVLKHIKNL